MDIRRLKKHYLSIIIFVIAVIFINYYVISPTLTILKNLQEIPVKLRNVKTAVAAQDYEFLPFEIDYLKENLVAIHNSAQRMKIFTVIPFFGEYIKDMESVSSVGVDILDTSVDLYALVQDAFPSFKFKGWGVVNSETDENAASSINTLAITLSTALPEYKEKFISIDARLANINTSKYPKKVKGIVVRDNLVELKQVSTLLIQSFDGLTSMLGYLPDITGEIEPRNYLVIMQNNNILRPSGGVLNAYAVFNVKNGKVKIAKSGDIVLLGNSSKFVQATGFVKDHLNTNKLQLKDAAYSADFQVSAKQIGTLWESASNNYPIDGIIIFDTTFITSLAKIITPEKASTLEDTLSLTNSVGKQNAQDKENKGILGSFLYELLNRAFSTSMANRAELIKELYKGAKEKHLQMYFYEEKFQQVVDSYELDGKVKDYYGDYLYISEANVGTLSSKFIKTQVEKSMTVVDRVNGKYSSEVLVKYTNSGPESYKALVNIYVPKNSSLVESSGSTKKPSTYIELDKTTFSAYIEVPANGVVTYSVKYNLPPTLFFGDKYNLYIQTQPGKLNAHYIVKLDGKTEKDMYITEDTELLTNL